MPLFRAELQFRPVFVRVAGIAIAVGVHLAVLAAILSSPPVKPEMEAAETVEVRFVEIADIAVDAAPSEDVAEQLPPVPVAEPETEPLPEPEPERLPETPAESEPEILPEPEPVIEPEPEAIQPEPKPEPKPKPVVKPKPRPVVKPAPKPLPKAAAPSTPLPAGKAAAPAVPQAPSAPVDPDRPRMIGQVDYLGKRPNPQYPRASERRGEQGRVVVRVLISAQGTVLNVSVQSSSGYSRLDEAALKAARTARFKPYTENGHAYQAMADIPFDFVL
ncbi:MAG TPA: energy transducer TonB [Candidimonas sp.]|nr:energy transducer TonB [Candidimonas sp.]